MIDRPLVSSACVLEHAAAPSLTSLAAAWLEWLQAFAVAYRARRIARAEARDRDALCSLSAHLLRDIGAPDEVVARHVEEIRPRSVLADLEPRI